MLNFDQDRLLLLQALREIVEEEIDVRDINPYVEQEVSEFITEMIDKRRQRKLKHIMNSLDKWIAETVQYRKLLKEQQKFEEAKLQKENEARSEHFNADQ